MKILSMCPMSDLSNAFFVTNMVCVWFVTHMTTLIILLLVPDIKKRGILCNNMGDAG